MIKNYFNVALRSLRKHRFYSIINILGLSIGLTCVLMITLYVVDELSYDNFQSDVDRIYRMDFIGNINGSEFNTALASPPTAQVMEEEYPEVVDATRLRGSGNWLIKKKNTEINFKEDDAIYADPNFFTFFDIKLLKGNPETCLKRPKTLVISESLSKKVFGEENPVGKTVVLDNSVDYEVTGVYEDMPSNMHFHFDMMLSLVSRTDAKSKVWLSFNFNTYLKLSPGADADSLEAKFPALVKKYIGPDVENFMGQSMEEFFDSGNKAGFSLFPMKDIHLHSDKLGELESNGDIKYVVIFSAIAIFILILACINFMNLATARSAGRAKEVGIRKVMGAYKTQLINQFLTEAFLITLLSILISLAITFFAIPYFNELANKELEVTSIVTPRFIAISVALLLIVSLLAGSYPAFYLSKFRPVEVLKGKLNLGMKSGSIRSLLVVIQFSVSIIMIIGTMIVFNQLRFIQNKKLGYNKDHIIMLHDAWLLDQDLNAFKNEALRDSRVLNGTIASFLPVKTTNNNNVWFKGKSTGSGESYVLHNYNIDYDYIETLGMSIKIGRNFSRDFPSDSSGILLNEAAVQYFGLEDPVGAYLSTYGGSQQNPASVPYKIIGVIENFHFLTMKESIEPLIFKLGSSRSYISFKISGEDVPATVDYLRTTWDEFAPGQPFEYSFLDERFNQLFENEQRIGSIFSVFAVLAIFIACLGLYGLAAFTAEQKTKEIGIRKVLGASIVQIISLISWEFLKLVGIAIVVGSVIAYFSMKEWLNDFAYRININNPLIFIIAGAMAIVIAWLTMSSQSYKAARTNPVNALKEE